MLQRAINNQQWTCAFGQASQGAAWGNRRGPHGSVTACPPWVD